MKRIVPLWTLLIVLLLSCDQTESLNPKFIESLRAWEEAKTALGNSYEYTSEMSSVFGFGSTTVIEVNKGEVVSRTYEAYTLDPETREKIVGNSWVETSLELNSHTEGAPTLTIDEIYFRCKNEILSVNESQNYISFSAENQGILSVCTYFPKNCADDCGVGFYITSITWP